MQTAAVSPVPRAGWARLRRAALSILLCAPGGLAAAPIDTLTARVSDRTGALSADALTYLSSSIEEGEKDGGPGIRAVVIAAEPGLVLDAHAESLLAAQPPDARVDALLVLQPALQTARIAVREAARDRLSTIEARVILREGVLPYLREGNLFAAVEQGTRRIEKSLRAVPHAAASAPAGRAASATAVDVPPYAPVVDLTGTLAAQDLEGLRADIAALQSRSGAQAAILMVPRARPETIEALALRVFDAWKPGRKGVDDGVLILVAKDDRQVRIEVGYGLEGVLTDLTSGRIISEHVRPLFKRGDFGGGLTAAVEQVGGVISGSPTAAAQPAQDYVSGWPRPWALIVAGVIVLAAIVSRFWLSALVASLLALVGCAAVMWLSQTSVATTLFIGCFAAALTFVLPAALLAEGRSGSGGSRGGSGGGGGGSGGGGSSGGGGASGSW